MVLSNNIPLLFNVDRIYKRKVRLEQCCEYFSQFPIEAKAVTNKSISSLCEKYFMNPDRFHYGWLNIELLHKLILMFLLSFLTDNVDSVNVESSAIQLSSSENRPDKKEVCYG